MGQTVAQGDRLFVGMQQFPQQSPVTGDDFGAVVEFLDQHGGGLGGGGRGKGERRKGKGERVIDGEGCGRIEEFLGKRRKGSRGKESRERTKNILSGRTKRIQGREQRETQDFPFPFSLSPFPSKPFPPPVIPIPVINALNLVLHAVFKADGADGVEGVVGEADDGAGKPFADAGAVFLNPFPEAVGDGDAIAHL